VAAVALLLVAAAVALAAILSGGGDDDAGERSAARPRAESPDRPGAAKGSEGSARDAEREGVPAIPAEPAEKPEAGGGEQPKAEEPQRQGTDAPSTTTTPTPATGGAGSTAVDPAAGRRLNDQGFALFQRGDYATAVPVLERAVASFPADSRDINYAYALYNLGASLHRSGRSKEAIPYLEKRLGWPNQTATVQRELDAAKRAAGSG
jgi:tetratricopeptide (TPR) repeat protein